MEDSAVVMEDSSRSIEKSQPASMRVDETQPGSKEAEPDVGSERTNNYERRKRPRGFRGSSLQHGSRGGRGGGHDNQRGERRRRQKNDMGRGEYFRETPDKRRKIDASREKREVENEPAYGIHFTQEQIDAEQRRPKHKVAVLIGYAGTGYKGMQIAPSLKTIEGDLFNAFIAAGAISKANADDPKKASLVRCARTDKGVHAACNMISLKLIIEDEDIVSKINENLVPQIRVWGIERTVGGFSCYQACDSRWYEYLVPSHAFLPPHPSSWLAKKLEELADEVGDRDNHQMRQQSVGDFWAVVERDYITPLMSGLDEDLRSELSQALHDESDAVPGPDEGVVAGDQPVKAGSTHGVDRDDTSKPAETTEEAAIIINEPALLDTSQTTACASDEKRLDTHRAQAGNNPEHALAAELSSKEKDRQIRLRAATKQLREAYTTAKRHYRIPQARIERIQEALTKYVGTLNYHNYTEGKPFTDPSANRHIKSFVVNPKPILIGDGPNEEKSEWLSLKVHGQSFMLHQIRKMIGMVALLVRCGSDLSTMDTSFTAARFSIPKAPALGLLLERPVFESYNTGQAIKHGREQLSFDKFSAEVEEFKQREIYQRIFQEERESNQFNKFFNHVDNFRQPNFLYVTSKGLEATKGADGKVTSAEVKIDGDEDNSDGGSAVNV